MLKKIALATTLLSSSLFSSDILTGNTRLACEAILCLSSSTRPSECSPSLSKYFSINLKHWSDTVKARGDFLKLCPVGSGAEKDREFVNLRDNIIKNLQTGCDLDQLNVVSQKVQDDYSSSYYIRLFQISPSLTKSCKALSSSAYTDIRPIYTCDPAKWFVQEDWKNGYEKKIISSISYKEYRKLSITEKSEYELSSTGFRTYVKYEKIPINKDCWVWQK